MPSGIDCELIRTTAELEAFQPQWNALWLEDPHAMPFQRPEWLLPWWHQFGQPDLRAVTVSQQGRLIASLPFYIYREPNSGERQLLLLGVGTTDYLDGIFSPDCRPEHVQAALDLLQTEGGWDVLHVSQLAPDSMLFQTLQRQSNVQRWNGESCSRMRAVTMAELPVKIRRNAMYYRNRAARRGSLEFTVADSFNCAEAFDALERLHTSRWQNAGEPGVLADPRVLAWHREALPLLQRSGMLRLCSLRLNGKIIGALYSLIDPPSRPERTQYFYLTAFSPNHADLRPGTLLLGFAIEHAAKEGVRTIDMLRGEEPYKKIWHVEPIPTYALTLPFAACDASVAYMAEISA
jgi:CelD/BcsL family acetyltransferase involved in cellulose biosynthesis